MVVPKCTVGYHRASGRSARTTRHASRYRSAASASLIPVRSMWLWMIGSAGLDAGERVSRDLVGSARHVLVAFLGGCPVYGYFDDHRLRGHVRHRSRRGIVEARSRPAASSLSSIRSRAKATSWGDGGIVSLNAGSAVVDGTPPTISWRYGGARWRSPRWATASAADAAATACGWLLPSLALLVCILMIRYGYRVDRVVTRVVNPPPASISWLVTVVYDAGAFGVTAVLVVLALVARRFEVARDIGLSVIGTGAVSGLLVLVLGADGGRGPGTAIHGYSVHFPVFQIAAFMAVATASLPYLARTLQRLVEVFVVLVAMASVVGGHGLPLNVLGSMAIGWGVTAIVHLVFGSPLGLPSTEDVVILLRELGVAAVDVQPSEVQRWGVARYRARLAVGSRRIDAPPRRLGVRA